MAVLVLAALLVAGCDTGDEPEPTVTATQPEETPTATMAPLEPTAFETREPTGPGPAVIVDPETFPEEFRGRVTPVPGRKAIILSSQEHRVTFHSTGGDSAELVAGVREVSGVDFAYPAYVPEGLVLRHAVAAREPVYLGEDDDGNPVTGVGEYTGGIYLVWIDSKDSQFFWDDAPPPNVGITLEQGRVLLGWSQVDEFEVVATFDDGFVVLHRGHTDDGSRFFDYAVMPPEPGDLALYHAWGVAGPEGALDEDEIVALLASLPR